MSRRLTQLEFIQKAKEIHNDKYDYSKTIYISRNDKIVIRCKKHGYFEQLATVHLMGCGCQKCSFKNSGKSQKFDLNIFIKKAKEIHGDKYDYSKSVYINSQTKLIIICKIHGEFKQIPNSHIIGRGCKRCGCVEVMKDKKLTTDQFIKRASQLHTSKYDYSKTNYTGWDDKITITCKKHGDFTQTAGSHLSHKGCPKCKSSINEDIIRKFLMDSNIKFNEQKTFPKCRYKRPLYFDFYLPENNLLIEFDGLQHYPSELREEAHKKFDVSNNVIRDEIKNKFCEEYGINLLRIKYTEDPIEKIQDYLTFLSEGL